MHSARAARLRRLWINVHLWIGVGLAVLLVPISLSGAALVWHDQIDAWLNPPRYAVSGEQVALPPSAYLDSARRALEPTLAPAVIRFPKQSGPVIVSARGRDSEGHPRIVDVYIDPPTARVLDVVDFRSSFFGVMHRLHENLTVPEYSGRSVVGWAGIGMLIMSMTGLWLWWPRNTGLLRGLRWARSPRVTFNLHHLVGFWISIPLALVSLTGIYLAFPQTARSMMSSVAEMAPAPQRGGFGGQIARQLSLTADRALDIGLTGAPGGKPLALFLPMQQRGERGPMWRIQFARAGGNDIATVMVDDRSARATLIAARSGDRAAAWIRWVHEGSHGVPLWPLIVFLTGMLPSVLAFTGVTMWLRKRANRKLLDREDVAAQLHPAE